MAAPINLQNASSFEQQLFMALEHAADLQRNDSTNPDGQELLSTSGHNDLGDGNGEYTFAGSFPTNSVANETNGTVELVAEPMFDLTP